MHHSEVVRVARRPDEEAAVTSNATAGPRPEDLHQGVVGSGRIAELEVADGGDEGRVLVGPDLEPMERAVLGQEVELAPVGEDRDCEAETWTRVAS